MSFWSDQQMEPKRQFRFLIEFTPPGQDSLQILAKSVDRPSYTVSSNSHAFFNHTFYYPGRVTWNSITLTLVDAVSPNASKIFYDYLGKIGYDNDPKSAAGATSKTITKESANEGLGLFKILEKGTKPGSNKTITVGTWTLQNAFITEVNFGSHSYDSEDMVDVTITLQYDWATYTAGKG